MSGRSAASRRRRRTSSSTAGVRGALDRADPRILIALVLMAALLATYLVVSLNPANEDADDIPQRMRTAYEHAADQAGDFEQECRLEWPVLAGIGRVETKHADGGKVTEDGVADPAIYGARLDGSGTGGNVTGVSDTDDGLVDGDAEYDRAVGPMQFIPATWETLGQDGDGDGARNPQDIDDAALSAARLLCANEELDLTDEETLRNAIKRYNNSEAYVDDVLTWADRYRR